MCVVYNVTKYVGSYCPPMIRYETRGIYCLNQSMKFLSAALAAMLVVQSAALPVSAAETEISDVVTLSAGANIPEEVIPWDDVTIPAEDLEEPTDPPIQETQPTEEEIIPEETVPEETWTDEEEPEDPQPEEAIPEETVPEETESKEIEYKIYNSVPLYFQNDYPDTMFGAGTVATSGCSITSLAMVATYLTGHEYQPDELAEYFGGRAENNVARMEYGIDQMKLPCRKAENWHVVMKELNRGKVVILLVDEKSIFTDSQHFVVLTGLTADGKILVNDSNASNYERWDLKEKLITGFPESDLWRGFNGAWAFDKSMMPKNPFIYYEEEIYVEPRYKGVTLTMDERELLARMVWVEARGEPFEGQQAVAEVVLNRLVASNFQDSIESIIMAQGQFNSARFLDEAEPIQTQYEAVEHALKGPYVTPINTVYFSQYPPSNGSVWGWIGGHCFSRQWIDEE